MNKRFGHAKNEHLCVNVKNDIIINYVFHGVVIDLKEKKAQLVFVSKISMGKLLMDYENMSYLFHFLDLKDFLKFHSYNTIEWGMASCMHELVMYKTKVLV